MDYGRPELADRLAADYVTGTLRGPARRRFEALLPAHATLRAAVRSWHEQLMPLTASIPPLQPPPEVWKRIEARISGAAAPATSATSATSATPATPARQRWWAQLAFWRGLSALATLLDSHPAAAELYENVNYQYAGLCRSSLDISLAAERLAKEAIKSAMRQSTKGPANGKS